MNPSLIHIQTEALLDVSKAIALGKFVSLRKGRPGYTELAITEACIYAFWLRNTDNGAESLHRILRINGPNKKPEELTWNWNLQNDNILLYVGKTTNFKNRLKKHLLLGTSHWEHKRYDYLNKKTTACQLRAGVEHLLKHSKHRSNIDFMLDNIYVNAIKLDGLANRFFAEDLAIGKGKPWFNVDSER